MAPATHDDAQLIWCVGCKKTICEPHWTMERSHKLRRPEHIRLRPADIKKSLPQARLAREAEEMDDAWAKGWLSDVADPDQLRELQKKEARNVWFGVDTQSRKSFVNQGLLLDLLRRSGRMHFGNQFPCIVSFLGATGAGKSSIIKGLNTLHNPSSARDMENPVAANSDGVNPTSSGVHLFADVSTAQTDRPFLYADCEGLFGGNSETAGETDDFIKESIDSLKRAGKWLIRPLSHGHKDFDREDFVRDVYPRILYAFSDILCYVAQQRPSHLETILKDLILWASRVHNTALNQAILPSCIIVINNTPLTDQCEDEEFARKTILGKMGRYPVQGDEIKKLANEWNEIAPSPSSRITNLKELFHRYFRDIQVLVVPPKSASSATSVRTQLQKLREKLHSTSTGIQRKREEIGGQVNTRQLDKYLSRAFEHFLSFPDRPFDFAKHTMIQEAVPTGLVQNAESLMSQLREQVPDILPDQFDSSLVNLLSSYASFNVLLRYPGASDDGHRVSCAGEIISTTQAARILERYGNECGVAYREFHQNSRCWYRRGTKQCRNTAKGHSKDHQDEHGKVFAFGEYHTYWSEKASQTFVERVRETSNKFISSSFFRSYESGLAQHFDNLRSQKEILKSLKMTETCLLCLEHVADISLSCGHAICRICLRAVGTPCPHRNTFKLPECGICGTKFSQINGWDRMVVKPEKARPRILAIDGGGVRSVISAQILLLLEAHLGLGISIHHFFDLIVGNSSGATIALGLGALDWSGSSCVAAMKEVATNGLTMRKLGLLERWFPSYDSFYCPEDLEKSLMGVLREHSPLIGDATYPVESSETLTMPAETGIKVRDVRIGAVAATQDGDSYQTWVLGNYTRNDGQGLPRAYRHAESTSSFYLWHAARCSSFAPGLFPATRAPNYELFVDANVTQVPTIDTAIKEAALIWPRTTDDHTNLHAHIGVSIGVGHSQSRIASFWWFSRVALHSWIERDVDQYETKFDPDGAWKKYYHSLPSSDRNRLRRLDVDFKRDPLPSMVAQTELDTMIDSTNEYFKSEGPHMELENTAEALLAALFYPVAEETRQVDDQTYTKTYTIACQLAEEHQGLLFRRLRQSHCVFIAEREGPGTVVQLEVPKQHQPFEQNFTWPVDQTGATEVQLFLAFQHPYYVEDGNKLGEKLAHEPAIGRSYHINGSPWIA
ncbi:hypothetical protein Purlil1_13511 [Purpureocillium lilacinum]|uniref:FabD/lysophospholipase-like protein n=1 Tax=Purpureocillium lilacinum TaxID=33203 RepID=A0ABR0BDU1_PURLI|nr:hypothetical protein Purlil1_13511 [Purpureocillium lilacinum]